MTYLFERLISTSIFALLLLPLIAVAQSSGPDVSGKRFKRIVVRNAIIIDGNGKPASGPKDIVIIDDKISRIVGVDPVAVKAGTARRPPKGDVEIDATSHPIH